MNDVQAKELCLALMKADSEDEVIWLLKEAGFWDMQPYWRFYGDYGTTTTRSATSRRAGRGAWSRRSSTPSTHG